jgi:hypothetical protein
MKGVVFTEFLDLVERRWGADTADDLVEECDLASGGAYTSVGTYDHAELLALLGRLSERSGTPVPDLIRQYASHLMARFAASFGEFFAAPDLFTFLESVDQHIHVEVRKLYPDAQLPEFTSFRDGDGRLVLEYRSARPFATLAEGLIMAAAAHYREPVTLEREALEPSGERHARFRLTRPPAVGHG